MNTECPICIEQITPNSNCCTTECNHTFHSSCLFKNFATSVGCPLCRKELVSYPQEEEGSKDDSDSEYDSDEEDEDNENYNPSFTKEQIYAVIKKGYTELDLMNSIILSHGHNTLLVPMEEEMWDKHEKIFELLTSIANKEVSVDYRDSITYASVLQGSPKVDKVDTGPSNPIF